MTKSSVLSILIKKKSIPSPAAKDEYSTNDFSNPLTIPFAPEQNETDHQVSNTYTPCSYLNHPTLAPGLKMGIRDALQAVLVR